MELRLILVFTLIMFNHFMLTLLAIFASFWLGAVAAIFVIRNNASKAKGLDDKGKTLLDALKGK